MEDWRDKNMKHVDEDEFIDEETLLDPHLKGHRRVVPERIWDEEFSADMTYNDVERDLQVDDKEQIDEQSFQITGWIAIILSIVSFIIMPIIMAAAGIILGVISRSKRAKVLGNTAIVISIISFSYSLFIKPMIF